ncbi:hypothetical protein EJB05_30557, partial [Eragrostis curvula]
MMPGTTGKKKSMQGSPEVTYASARPALQVNIGWNIACQLEEERSIREQLEARMQEMEAERQQWMAQFYTYMQKAQRTPRAPKTEEEQKDVRPLDEILCFINRNGGMIMASYTRQDEAAIELANSGAGRRPAKRSMSVVPVLLCRSRWRITDDLVPLLL